MKKNLSIGFVGLTHLGLNYLAASSEKNFKVVGLDLNQNRINKLNPSIEDILKPIDGVKTEQINPMWNAPIG